MKTSLVLGVNGQDGSYLAEMLISKGHCVWGIGLQTKARYPIKNDLFKYIACDLKDQSQFKRVIEKCNPDEIFHLAAVHGSAGFAYEELWGDALDVNVKCLHTILEYARCCKKKTRIFYASSAKVFGTPLEGIISIKSIKRSDCLYAVTKIAAENLINYYRETHGISCSIGYMFNHESIRRPSSFFIPKIMNILISGKKNKNYQDKLYSLDFYCDWGSAEEYMKMAVDLVKTNKSRDLLFATGNTLYARTFAKNLFDMHGLNYKDHIIEEINQLNSNYFEVDISDTLEFIGYVPNKTTIVDVCNEFYKGNLGVKNNF